MKVMKRTRYSYVNDVASEEQVRDKILFLLNVVAADPKVVEKKNILWIIKL